MQRRELNEQEKFALSLALARQAHCKMALQVCLGSGKPDVFVASVPRALPICNYEKNGAYGGGDFNAAHDLLGRLAANFMGVASKISREFHPMYELVHFYLPTEQTLPPDDPLKTLSDSSWNGFRDDGFSPRPLDENMLFLECELPWTTDPMEDSVYREQVHIGSRGASILWDSNEANEPKNAKLQKEIILLAQAIKKLQRPWRGYLKLVCVHDEEQESEPRSKDWQKQIVLPATMSFEKVYTTFLEKGLQEDLRSLKPLPLFCPKQPTNLNAVPHEEAERRVRAEVLRLSGAEPSESPNREATRLVRQREASRSRSPRRIAAGLSELGPVLTRAQIDTHYDPGPVGDRWTAYAPRVRQSAPQVAAGDALAEAELRRLRNERSKRTERP
jgi:hypothetical protein